MTELLGYFPTGWLDGDSQAFSSSFLKRNIPRLRMFYKITEHTIDKRGQILIMPDVEVNMWWTNLAWTDDEIIASYHAHGECERFHSEFKLT